MKAKHFLWVVLAMFLAAPVVWVRLQIVRISFDIHDLKNREKILREDISNIEARLSEERSPYKLEGEAKALGMQAPRANQILVLKDEP